MWRSERERTEGFCKIWFRQCEAAVMLRRSDFDPLCLAIQRGDPVYEGEDLQGDRHLIVLVEIASMLDASPQGIAQYDAEEEAKREYNIAHGLDKE